MASSKKRSSKRPRCKKTTRRGTLCKRSAKDGKCCSQHHKMNSSGEATSKKTVPKKTPAARKNRTEAVRKAVTGQPTEAARKAPRSKKQEEVGAGGGYKEMENVTSTDTYVKVDGKSYLLKWQLGASGKEGTAYLVQDGKDSSIYAMKEFKRQKATSTFEDEVFFQTSASEVNAAPGVIASDSNKPPRIVMMPMKRTIVELLQDQEGILTEAQQKDIVALCARLDEAGIYHNDPNPLNLMEDPHGKFKWIDYGMSKYINEKENGRYPNTRAIFALLHGGMQGLRTVRTRINEETKETTKIQLYTGDFSILKTAYIAAYILDKRPMPKK